MPEQNAIFTIASAARLPSVFVLFDSIRCTGIHAHLIVLVVDDNPHSYSNYLQNTVILSVFDLNLPKNQHFLFRYSSYELVTAIKPYAFLKIFNLGYNNVIYLDSDIFVFESLNDVFSKLRNGADLILTPHLLTGSLPDEIPGDVGIMQHGVFNLGFLAAANTKECIEILEWWAGHLEFGCVVAKDKGLFCDQKYMDLVPGFSDRVYILRDAAYNVAYWNILKRNFGFNAEGRWVVFEQPLVFFHFSGFSVNDPSRLSVNAPTYKTEMPASVVGLIEFYKDKLLEAGYERFVNIPYPFDQFVSGTRIPDYVRHNFRENHPAWPGDPFVNGDWLIYMTPNS